MSLSAYAQGGSRISRRLLCKADAASAASSSKGEPSYGLFVCSGSTEVTEAVAATGVDWMCLDAQHGAVPYDRLKFM